MTIRVVHGANEEWSNLSGKSIGTIRKSLQEVFNIPADATAFLNGVKCDDETIVKPGDNLEFFKESTCT